jgi:hypothetical protein
MRQSSEILRGIFEFQPIDGNWKPLDHLLDELWSIGTPSKESLQILFEVFERFPEDDGAGVLWSIVHGVESLPYDYEALLRQSHSRVPSLMARIMLTRLANTTKTG